MKKRMLVTTIALVLVIAVALTTSSLAWFSSSATVKAGELSFTANTASGANLVLSNLGDTALGNYDTAVVELPSKGSMNPAQGLPALGTLDTDYTVSANTITYKDGKNPFLKADKVEQETGFAVADQKVTLVAGGNYLAGGFNYANATGDALKNGVTVKATIKLTPVTDGSAVIAGNKVKKGFVAYDGGWKDAGYDVTASTVCFKAQDVALLASIRIAMFGAANVISGEAFAPTFELKSIWDFNGTGFILTKNGYALGAAGSNDQYATDAGINVTKPSGSPYGTITAITPDANVAGTFTFTQAFSTPITGGNAGSIAYVIWMDGWDESALPGVSLGTFGMSFEVSVGSVG